MTKAKKRVANRKKSSKRGRTSAKHVRKKVAGQTTEKKQNAKPAARKPAVPKEARTSEKLFFFTVDKYGTISEADFKKPKINRDIFDNISIQRLTTPENIIDEIEYYDALVERFRWLARDERKSLLRRIEQQESRDNRELRRMKLVAKKLEDEDDGWKEWIEIEGNEGAPRFGKLIVDWLAAPIEWQEDMPDNADAQGSAKRFFEREESATLEKLGVSIVEGEGPGSTYYAAELNRKVEEANEIAMKLGLSYRFREESGVASIGDDIDDENMTD